MLIWTHFLTMFLPPLKSYLGRDEVGPTESHLQYQNWNEGKKLLLMSVKSPGFDTSPCYFWLQGHAFKSSGLILKQMCLLRYLLRFIINSRTQLFFLNRTASLFIAFHLQTAAICTWVESCFLKQRREGKKVCNIVPYSHQLQPSLLGMRPHKRDLAKLSCSLCSSAQLRPCIKRMSSAGMSFPYRGEYVKLKTPWWMRKIFKSEEELNASYCSLWTLQHSSVLTAWKEEVE